MLKGRKKNSWFFPDTSSFVITRPNCALDRSTILCLYVPGFQRQVFKHVKILSERSKESKEQKKNKGSVLVAESAYNAQIAQLGLVIVRLRTRIQLVHFCALAKASVLQPTTKLFYNGRKNSCSQNNQHVLSIVLIASGCFLFGLYKQIWDF